MKKVILITLTPLLLADAYVTYSMNYKSTEKINEATAAQQTKKQTDARTTLIVSENEEHDLLIKTPPLRISNRQAQPIKHMNQQIDVKGFF